MSKYFFIWLVVSIFFMAAEFATASFVYLFFASSAVLVAIAALCGVDQPLWQILMFGTLGFLSWVLLKKRLVDFTHRQQSSPEAFQQNESLQKPRW